MVGGPLANSRRRFLRNATAATAAAAFFPALVPASALGRDGSRPAPSNRVAIGVLGLQQGWESFYNSTAFADVEGVALCDLDSERLEFRLGEARRRRNCSSVRGYRDYREFLDDGRLDAVILAAPDHWHGVMCVAAARKGLDIYGEKPLARTLKEGRAIVEAVKQHGRVWQTGMWQRSKRDFLRAVQIVRSGRIGKIKRAHVGTLGFWGNHPENARNYAKVVESKFKGSVGKPPPNIDYDMWVGPAQWMEYHPHVVHYNWRWVLNFGGGNLLDWVSHYFDIAQWGLNFDNTGPVKISGKADFATTPPWDAPKNYRYDCTYADGTVVTVDSSYGTKWYGEDGQWIYVSRERLEASDKSILECSLPEESIRDVYVSHNHWRNWIDCIKTRGETITPVETAHRTASVGHLGLIAVTTGRTIHWDPVSETIKDDPLATAMLSPVYRAPYGI